MDFQIDKNDVLEYLKGYDFWEVYTYQERFNRALEFNAKGEFRVRHQGEILYQGNDLSKAVWAFNWFGLDNYRTYLPIKSKIGNE